MQVWKSGGRPRRASRPHRPGHLHVGSTRSDAAGRRGARRQGDHLGGARRRHHGLECIIHIQAGRGRVGGSSGSQRSDHQGKNGQL